MKGMGLLTPDSLDPGCILDPVFLSMHLLLQTRVLGGSWGWGGHELLTFSLLALVLFLFLLLMPLSLCLTNSIQASRGSTLCACAMVGPWNRWPCHLCSQR